MSLVLGLFKGVWGYIVAGLATLVAIFAALSRAKKAGRDEVIAKTKEAEVENVKKANKVEREIAVSKLSDIQRKLRDKYSRD